MLAITGLKTLEVSNSSTVVFSYAMRDLTYLSVLAEQCAQWSCCWIITGHVCIAAASHTSIRNRVT
jgi:hypothetical protein